MATVETSPKASLPTSLPTAYRRRRLLAQSTVGVAGAALATFSISTCNNAVSAQKNRAKSIPDPEIHPKTAQRAQEKSNRFVANQERAYHEKLKRDMLEGLYGEDVAQDARIVATTTVYGNAQNYNPNEATQIWKAISGVFAGTAGALFLFGIPEYFNKSAPLDPQA